MDKEKWVRHKISSLNKTTREGVCSVCGPTKVKLCNTGSINGSYRCRKLIKLQKFRKRYRGMLTEEQIRDGVTRPDSCSICGNNTRRICFDHSHASLTFRGWLCVNCNLVLGLTDDKPDTLRALAFYLER